VEKLGAVEEEWGVELLKVGTEIMLEGTRSAVISRSVLIC